MYYSTTNIVHSYHAERHDLRIHLQRTVELIDEFQSGTAVLLPKRRRPGFILSTYDANHKNCQRCRSHMILYLGLPIIIYSSTKLGYVYGSKTLSVFDECEFGLRIQHRNSLSNYELFQYKHFKISPRIFE